MQFFVSITSITPLANESCIRLEPTTWDDYSYRTEFILHFASPGGSFRTIGLVKLLARHYAPNARHMQTKKGLDRAFPHLDPAAHCSLGQSSSYYRLLGQLDSEVGLEVLEKLNDVCFIKPTAEKWWVNHPGYSTSLLRINSAIQARQDARLVFHGKQASGDVQQHIRFSANQSHGAPAVVEFDFDGDLPIPGRLNVLVGKNGTGKTSMLAEMGWWFAKDSNAPTFSRVLIISLNPHDTAFGHLDVSNRNIRFIGYRPATSEVEDLIHLADKLTVAAAANDDKLPIVGVNADAEAQKRWVSCLTTAFPSPKALASRMPRFVGDDLSSMLTELQPDKDWIEFVCHAFDDDSVAKRLEGHIPSALAKMSAGQRVLTTLYASIFTHLARKTLVLIDEPECHLHPSLVARFIRKFNLLLDQRAAFAIIGTHSPIILQETPSRFVQVLHRESGELTAVSSPPFETFGATFESITEHLFETDFRSSHWKRVLMDMAAKDMSMEQAEEHVGGSLSPSARSFLAYHIIRRNRG